MKDYSNGISIIIPVYNGELFLEECILSVLNQPNKNLEVIIIDDGSEDKSYKIYNKYLELDDRIVIYKQENKGVASARNKGITMAKYNYIAFLDCDDVWCSNIFDEELNNLLKEGFDMIGFSYSMANNTLTREKKIKVNNKELIGSTPMDNILSGLGKHHSSFLYSTALIKKNNIFIYGKRNEDNIFKDSCLYKSRKIKYIEKEIFLYRNNPHSVTHECIEIDILYKDVIHNWLKMINWISTFEEKDSIVINYYTDLIVVFILEMIEQKSKLKLYLFNDDNIIIDKTFESYLKTKSDFKLHKGFIKKYDLFMNNRKLFYLKYFFIGKIINILRKISKVKILKTIKEIIIYDKKIYNK